MKILLVYPQYPDTFWSFKHALRFILKKAAFPPLGILTVASMLPSDWEKRLVDMNVTSLTDTDLKWADYLFLSAMAVQRQSVQEVIQRAKKIGAKIVAGGPLFTTEPENFSMVDHLVLNEAEITLPQFLADLARGNPKQIYTTSEHPDITSTPVPDWSLIKMKKYSSMSLQYSRGCPFNCEFCDITFLDGHVPRTKSRSQILAELDALYNHGWRGSVFIVDDNFIGNKKKLKSETLPAIIDWQKKKKYPFSLFTEVSINLADDEELMHLMVEAGFNRVFIGIETPNEASLTECSKNQNTSRDLEACVKIIQNNGFEVMGGFIVGFDSDPVTIFKSQINFIQKSGIVTAMVGLLNAPKGTRLYQRLKKENRLLKDSFSGDNMDSSLNFIPKMNRETLINGYRHVLNTIYSPKHYYERMKVLLREYKPRAKASLSQINWSYFLGFINTLWFLGVWEKGRWYFWRLFVLTLLKRPRSIPLFVILSAYGYHFRKVIRKYTSTPVKENI
ncbi:MAG: B12-binding domain-containing radical SAM protein [Dehalococcoidales bacterium]|jgi:radical SAM superfamily enzyme YgiQ (UPF0313 family)|nr:B12-binding domain-containing radical SAM protein [Dehalococcoidales bacterium]